MSRPFGGSGFPAGTGQAWSGEAVWQTLDQLRGQFGRKFSTRVGRGDVRAAVLALLAEQPMHGYQIIHEVEERSGGVWKPSPGSVYPTLQLLVDEGLITPTESEGSKKTFELTAEGRTAAAAIETAPWDEIAEDADPNAVNLRAALGQLFGAVGQAAHAASSDQQQRILDIVNTARREIYQILGEE